jgi:hypothetical protein
MQRLSNEDVRALGRAVGLDIEGPDLARVSNGLTAILELMAEIDVPGANLVEPLPLILQPQEERDE